MPDPRFMSAVGDAMRDLLLAQVCSAVAGVSIDIFGTVVKPFAFLTQWSSDLTNAATEALISASTTVIGITGGSDDPTAVGTTVGAIQSNIQSNSAAIAALTAMQTGSQVGGAVIDEPFGTVGALSGYATWVVGGPDLGPAVLRVTEPGRLELDGTPSQDGTKYALNTKVMETDDHGVTLVSADTGEEPAHTSAIVRAAADMSKFVYFHVFGSTGFAYLGYATYAAGVWTFHDWGSIRITQAQGQSVRLTAIGNTYIGSIGGTPILSKTDTAGDHPVGPSYRSVGLLINVKYSFPFYRYGWGVASFASTDLTAPAVVGTGWTLHRSPTTTVALPGSSWQYLGAGTLDTQGSTKGVTVTDLGRGVITILRSGWYMVSARVILASAAGTGNYFILAISRTPVGGSPYRALAGDDETGSQAFTCSVSGPVYCQAGDTLQPQVFQSGSNNVAGGSVPGDSTFFVGALINS